MATKDFDAARRERLRQFDPVRFRLGGQEFACLAVVPLGIAFDLADLPDYRIDETDDDARALRVYAAALEQVIPDADVERFRAVLRAKDDPVDGQTIADIFKWVCDEYAGRPTSRSNGSSAGPRRNGGASNRKRSPEGSTSPP